MAEWVKDSLPSLRTWVQSHMTALIEEERGLGELETPPCHHPEFGPKKKGFGDPTVSKGQGAQLKALT